MALPRRFPEAMLLKLRCPLEKASTGEDEIRMVGLEECFLSYSPDSVRTRTPSRDQNGKLVEGRLKFSPAFILCYTSQAVSCVQVLAHTFKTQSFMTSFLLSSKELETPRFAISMDASSNSPPWQCVRCSALNTTPLPAFCPRCGLYCVSNSDQSRQMAYPQPTAQFGPAMMPNVGPYLLPPGGYMHHGYGNPPPQFPSMTYPVTGYGQSMYSSQPVGGFVGGPHWLQQGHQQPSSQQPPQSTRQDAPPADLKDFGQHGQAEALWEAARQKLGRNPTINDLMALQDSSDLEGDATPDSTGSQRKASQNLPTRDPSEVPASTAPTTTVGTTQKPRAVTAVPDDGLDTMHPSRKRKMGLGDEDEADKFLDTLVTQIDKKQKFDGPLPPTGPRFAFARPSGRLGGGNGRNSSQDRERKGCDGWALFSKQQGGAIDGIPITSMGRSNAKIGGQFQKQGGLTEGSKEPGVMKTQKNALKSRIEPPLSLSTLDLPVLPATSSQNVNLVGATERHDDLTVSWCRKCHREGHELADCTGKKPAKMFKKIHLPEQDAVDLQTAPGDARSLMGYLEAFSSAVNRYVDWLPVRDQEQLEAMEFAKSMAKEDKNLQRQLKGLIECFRRSNVVVSRAAWHVYGTYRHMLVDHIEKQLRLEVERYADRLQVNRQFETMTREQLFALFNKVLDLRAEEGFRPWSVSKQAVATFKAEMEKIRSDFEMRILDLINDGTDPKNGGDPAAVCLPNTTWKTMPFVNHQRTFSYRVAGDWVPFFSVPSGDETLFAEEVDG